MSWPTRLLLLARIVFMKDRVEAEMSEEMRLHIELETEDHVRADMHPKAARRAALVVVISESLANALWPNEDAGSGAWRSCGTTGTVWGSWWA